MINKIDIKNFKSIEDLSIELGRVNVVIGANGSGKTNILEAIVMGAAASSDKLDYEFIGNRMRVTSPEFMRNAFSTNNKDDIKLNFSINEIKFSYNLINYEGDYRTWINNKKQESIWEKMEKFRNEFKINEPDRIHFFEKDFINTFAEEIAEEEERKIKINKIANFLIYTPELSYLKKFEEQAQITPLGVKGEGLFYTLKQAFKNKKQMEDIKEYLHLLDWFEDIKIPNGLMSNEYKIAIKDRFISSELNYFDQRSSNEGFLYLLFYLVLFTSENTPPFFAIDNIETGFNPKLCTELIIALNQLAIKYNKQVIITTHNAAILDGINLNDDNQRLFVTNRNREGKTYIERIQQKPNTKMKLSELWTKGIIGGIPDNF